MARRMESINDLIEEAKARTLAWIICVIALAYLLSLTSNLVWLNVPISFIIIVLFRYLSLELEFHRRSPLISQPSYLSHLKQRQLSPHDPLLFPARVSMRWKRKIDSPVVQAAVDDFTQKIVQEFVTDLWYSSITPDHEVPEQIKFLINDVFGELSQRIKRINLIDLLTRDMVDLIGSHIELFRKNQASIGRDVMRTLSSEERDERLKQCLAATKELHPALISPDNEYKVLRQLMAGVVAIVLRPQEAQCPLVRCLAQELLACAVMQPVMNFASPGFINEVIEFVVLSTKESEGKNPYRKESASSSDSKSSKGVVSQNISKDLQVSVPGLHEAVESKVFTKERNSVQSSDHGVGVSSSHCDSHSDFQIKTASYLHSRPADWAQTLDAVRQRRTQVLAPENLDNLWTKGRNYRKKDIDIAHVKSGPSVKSLVPRQDIEGTTKQEDIMQVQEFIPWGETWKSTTTEILGTTEFMKKSIEKMALESSFDNSPDIGGKENQNVDGRKNVSHQTLIEKDRISRKQEENKRHEIQTLKIHNKQSKSGGTPSDAWQSVDTPCLPDGGEAWESKKLQGLKLGEANNFHYSESPSTDLCPQAGNKHVSKLKCWVLGAHFEKVGSQSFAVYSIAVTNSENQTWFVDRRYRNFEQLHRRLRDIPNYTLHLPPKRFLSSSLDDYFVQQRCILLDKYLKDILSIPNVAEQHEVWDFLSATSKTYSCGKTPSVIKTLAVNVDDAMDDIVRQLKDVSDGLRRKVVGTSSSAEGISTTSRDHQFLKLPLISENASMNGSNSASIDRSQSISDDEEGVGESIVHEDGDLLTVRDGWHSDGEIQLEPFPPKILVRSTGEVRGHDIERIQQSERKFERFGSDGCSTIDSLTGSEIVENEGGEPLEWTPPKLTVPLLNLVDKIFQLKRRGWVRRQVFWISKQILQLAMEDAIDDWLLRQIEWLRRDDVIALGVRWIQDVLWPNGVFISKIIDSQETDFYHVRQVATPQSSHIKISAPLSFEQQLEMARRARFVHDTLLGGAPSTLVSLIGGKQYRRCARDIFFFLQSSICVKQLAYSLLELLLITIFPELHDVVLEIHGSTHR